MIKISIIGICLFFSSLSFACENAQIKVTDFKKALTMALKLHYFLEEHQPEVALVGRVGSDLSRYGLTYSHMGIVIRDHPKGKWIFTHLLNHCNSDQAALFDEGLIPFFTDNPYHYQAVVILLKPQLEKELKNLLKKGIGERIFEHHYNMLANPYALDSQNSNQWLLEVIASAQSIFLNAGQRVDAQTILKLSGYQAEKIRLSVWQKIGIRFKNNVNLAGQPHWNSAEFVSVRSIIDYLKYNQQVQSETTLLLNDNHSQTTFKPIYQKKAVKVSVEAAQQFWERK